MTFDRQHLRLSILFDIAGTDEVAETGVNLAGSTTFNALTALGDPTDSDLRSFGSTLGTVMLNAEFQWADYSSITGVKLAAIDVNGHYLTDARAVAITPQPTGTAFNVLPQNSVEFGLWSGEKVGHANFGKMYLPHVKQNIIPVTPYVGSTDVTAALNHFSAWITGLNGSAGGWTGSPTVKVMSRLLSGTTKDVVRIRLGRVVDTQRRRRDRLTELYQSHSV